jgi:hypothetical protein
MSVFASVNEGRVLRPQDGRTWDVKKQAKPQQIRIGGVPLPRRVDDVVRDGHLTQDTDRIQDDEGIVPRYVPPC